MSRFRPRRPVVISVAVVAATVLAVALFAFQPWKLFVDTTVSEASPLDGIEAVETIASPDAESTPVPLPTAADSAPAPAPSEPASEPSTKAKKAAVVAEGTFVSHEHGTSGTASVITLGDGRRVLRLEDLDTSNGPDLRVWLSDADVLEGTDGWFVFDDGDYADLGELKGNKGSQNYAIPDSVDLEDLTSVSVWCARFKVSFGAAELVPVST